MKNTADVIIVGGGPAGLSCALILGRCGRKVIVFDTGNQRNKSSDAMHGFISRDGEDPRVFLAKARNELKKYDVTMVMKRVMGAKKTGNFFTVVTEEGEDFFSKKVLLATGLCDSLPKISNIENFYGKSVFHCPYCDGWEFRNLPWVVYAVSPAAAVEVCLRLKTWTSDITLLSSYVKGLRGADIRKLQANGIKIVTGRVGELKGRNGRLSGILLESGQILPANALFFSVGHAQQCDLGSRLKCNCNSKGLLTSNRLQQTNVEGLYVAGDTAWDMQLVIIAAAEGARAGVAINSAINKESRIKVPKVGW